MLIPESISHRGYAIIDHVLSHSELENLKQMLEDSMQTCRAVRRRSDVYAMRNLLNDSPAMRGFCNVAAGGIMAMRPLLLHSSHSSNDNSRQRRILHIEYSSDDLAPPLEWAFVD